MVPPGLNPDQETETLIEDCNMASLACTFMATQASSNTHANAFTAIMEGLKIACGLMTGGFQDACVDVEQVVRMTVEEATAQNREFMEKAE